MTTINIRKAVADPIPRDIGNKTIQGKVVSKSIQFGMFTTNQNAVWAGNNQLRKESYPFASITLKINRNHFDLEVGDVFLFSYAKYGITNMVLRILLVRESNLNSEEIVLHCIEDFYSVTQAITSYSGPTDSAGTPPDYTPVAFTKETVQEAPYVITEKIKVIPLAKREAESDLGMDVYFSLDGSSYSKIGQAANIVPYGTLQADYNTSRSIDDGSTGILVDFSVSDIDNIDTITWAETLTGTKNMLLINNELMTFQTITPVSGTVYRLTNIIRGRYGTVQVNHTNGDDVWVISKSQETISNNEFLPGTTRKFKLPPYNIRYVGSVADSSEISLSITGKAKTPYIPINFNCNGVSFASRYVDDCVLTWNGRKRGEGAGIGTPGTVLPTGDLEGYFDVEVWVSSVLVRTQADLTVETWTYTSGMNISDNGSLASEIEFKITNHRSEGGDTFTSSSVSVITKLTT